jgi:hypothetical protein
MLKERKRTKPNCKVEEIQTFLVRERIWEEDAENARLKEIKYCAWKEKLRMKQPELNDFTLMLPQKANGLSMMHPLRLPRDS